MESNRPHANPPRNGLRSAAGGRERDHSSASHAQGRQHPVKTVAHPRGTGNRVLTNADIVVKYRSLTRSVISADRQSAIEKTVLDLETLDDISKLTALLTPTVRSALE